jgi:hypothetical protein
MMAYFQATGMLLLPKGTWNDISAPSLLKNSNENVLENSLTISRGPAIQKPPRCNFLSPHL